MAQRKPLKFWWSHESKAHRRAVRAANSLLKRVPLQAKYRVTSRLTALAPPYSLVGPGDTVIQVGAPSDTLSAGRSRAVQFAFRTGDAGLVIAVEPDAASCNALEQAAKQLGLKVEVLQSAVWSHSQRLTIYIDPKHPATSFTAGSKAYSADRLAEYTQVELSAKSIDDLVLPMGIDRVRLLSITTNGAERQILAGARGLLAQGIDYIALARTEESFDDLMASLGYNLLVHDDRGFTFVHTRREKPDAGHSGFF